MPMRIFTGKVTHYSKPSIKYVFLQKRSLPGTFDAYELEIMQQDEGERCTVIPIRT